LEGPLTDCVTGIEKVGPVVKNDPKLLDIMHYLGIGAVTLANNHIMDYGIIGLADTIKTLEDMNIAYCGIDRDGSKRENGIIISREFKGKKVSLVGLCEREFNVVPQTLIGAAAASDIEIFYQISAARSNSDFLIVMFHGGVESYSLPSPITVARMRYLVDLGADCVIMHHSHCISGYEEYNGKAIYYGLGNLIFPYAGLESDAKWNTGYLVQLTIEDNDMLTTKILPYQQRYQGETLYIESLTEESALEFDESFSELSKQIGSPDLLLRAWEQFCSKGDYSYLRYFSPQNMLFRLMRKMGLSTMNTRHARTLVNIIRNSSHRERAICALEQWARLKGSII
jgi:poly-gamma-glutamate synthesis protein (capsule biosynthesis protein)